MAGLVRVESPGAVLATAPGKDFVSGLAAVFCESESLPLSYKPGAFGGTTIAPGFDFPSTQVPAQIYYGLAGSDVEQDEKNQRSGLPTPCIRVCIKL
jgi:hypothetical protein